MTTHSVTDVQKMREWLRDHPSPELADQISDISNAYTLTELTEKAAATLRDCVNGMESCNANGLSLRPYIAPMLEFEGLAQDLAQLARIVARDIGA